MDVTLLSGNRVQIVSPVAFAKEPYPAPSFWANTVQEAITRGFQRLAERQIRRFQRLSKMDFGWGDAGFYVYEKIGAIEVESLAHTSTWTVYFYFGHDLVKSFVFKTDIGCWKKAAEITIEGYC